MKTCSIWNICWLSNRVLSLCGPCIRIKICFLWKKAVQPRGMTKSQSVASTSATPAKLLSIYPQKLLDLPNCCPHPCRWMCRCRTLCCWLCRSSQCCQTWKWPGNPSGLYQLCVEGNFLHFAVTCFLSLPSVCRESLMFILQQVSCLFSLCA